MIVITGNRGQLGFDIEKVCQDRGLEYLGIDINELDITDKNAVNEFFQSKNIDTFIHCAAFTAVDVAEDNPELCYRVNTEAVKYLVDACKKHNVKFIFISTDYVFSGQKEGIYVPEDKTSPLSVYGKSKADSEAYIQENLEKYYIVRISWAFGLNGKNFVRTMLRLGKEKPIISVVSDQIGSPTYTKDIAPLLVDMSQTDKYGVYHATNEGYCSWADFTRYILEKAGLTAEVKDILTIDYPTKAARPMNSKLSKDKLEENGFTRLPSWQSAVDRYLQELIDVEGSL
ncbi:MAG TPA: dTDP-4-dehydrorhamnose reductase [Erysipelotrichaceae bacterium]|nr:dTDP-4-dehydrorhamnose reductase [Erysipelotrichaceae bacterium]